MRIAQIAPPWMTLPPSGYGGIELVVDLLARGLAERGHEVTLFAPEGSTSTARVVSPLPAPGVGRIGDLWYDLHHALTAYAGRNDFDVIHDHTMLGSALGAVAGSPPVVHTLHGPWVERERAHYGLIHDRIHLVAISEPQRASNPDVRYAATIPNGIDLDAYPLNEGERDDYLVYIGRANPEKAPELALELAHRVGLPLKALIKRRDPPELEHWSANVAHLVGEDDEIFEEVDHETKVELLGRARAFVFPIQWEEPFGLVMAEALACGTPVVATPRGAATSLVDDGVNGFLREDLDGLEAALAEVGRISPRACRESVERSFSAAAMVDGYEALFERLVAGQPC